MLKPSEEADLENPKAEGTPSEAPSMLFLSVCIHTYKDPIVALLCLLFECCFVRLRIENSDAQ